MKAIIYTQYGPPDVLRLVDLEKPTPKDNEVLIKVRAATVTAGDCNIRGFTFVPPGFSFLGRLMFGLRRPKHSIPGMELAGEIEAVGSTVTRFKSGDKVWGISVDQLGAYAEYLCLPESARLVKKPGNVSFESAASMPFGATTALYFLRDIAKLQPGQKILIIGASGGTGVFAVQIAKFYGAEVTGVCSTTNLELVQSLGADKTIDYTRQDFTQNGETYDVIFDMVHGQGNFSHYKASLKPHGIYLAGAGGLKEFSQMAWTSLSGGKKVVAASVPDRQEDLNFLNELLAAGTIKSFIDRRYPLAQTAEAHRYVDTGRKRGSVVITIDGQA
jgi:NADPH:quinone reductase-like Zn-dependent oxidoreductase